jgi:hypothetical protein
MRSVANAQAVRIGQTPRRNRSSLTQNWSKPAASAARQPRVLARRHVVVEADRKTHHEEFKVKS